jgi:hypothetical protein
MRLDLHPHPDTPSAAASRLAVEVGPLSGRQVRLRYTLEGALDAVLVPAPAEPERIDDLWRRTCFEAFVRVADKAAYYEFNFSPSTEWAVYRFDGYRASMNKPVVLAPRVAGAMEGDAYVLHAAFDLPGDGPWRVALAAVIEDVTGAKSYWALRHPPGKPDFHHADGFILELP